MKLLPLFVCLANCVLLVGTIVNYCITPNCDFDAACKNTTLAGAGVSMLLFIAFVGPYLDRVIKGKFRLDVIFDGKEMKETATGILLIAGLLAVPCIVVLLIDHWSNIGEFLSHTKSDFLTYYETATFAVKAFIVGAIMLIAIIIGGIVNG